MGIGLDFNVEKIGENVFKVIPRLVLESGEYAFIYRGQIPDGIYNQSVFDFSIR